MRLESPRQRTIANTIQWQLVIVIYSLCFFPRYSENHLSEKEVHISSADSKKRPEPLVMVEMVFPNATNHYGTMFGGKVLDLMDRAAFLAATRFTEQSIVTASMERIDFFHPVKNGHLVELQAQVVYTGRTSLTVRVDLFAENPLRRYREQASQGYFNMVSVDENGRPMKVPQLLVETEEEKADWNHAKSLLDFRKKQAQACKP